jgi:hypothetical protein
MMKALDAPVSSLTEFVKASPDEIAPVLEVLATLEMSLPSEVGATVEPLDATTTHVDTPHSYASTALDALPRDPADILSLDTETRRMFAGPTHDIKAEYLDDPYYQLYEIYPESAGGSISSDFKAQRHLSDQVKQSVILDSEMYTSICSLDDFNDDWNSVTGGCFDGVDLSNCFIAGGSIMNCLRGSKNGKSDIDIFVYGLDETEATARLEQVLADVSKKRRELDVNAHNVVVHSKHAVTLVGYSAFPPVQFILRAYRSATEILLGFDVDSCCVGMGSDMKPRANARGWRALVTGLNAIDLTRRSPSYEYRLGKYSKRGFGVYVGHGFDKKHLELGDIDYWPAYHLTKKRRTISGLARLLDMHFNDNYNHKSYSSVPIEDSVPVANTKSKYSDDVIGDYSETIYTMPNYTTMCNTFVKRLFEHELERRHGKTTPDSSGLGIVRKYDAKGDVVTFMQFNDDSRDDYMSISKFIELKWLVTNPGSQGKLVKTDDGDLMTGSFAPINDSAQSWFHDYVVDLTSYTTLHSLLLGKHRSNGIKPEQVLEIVERNRMASVTKEVDAAFHLGKSVVQSTFNPRFFLGVSKVRRQVHPFLQLNNEAMLMIAALNAQVNSMISNKSVDLLVSQGKHYETVSSRVVQTCVRLNLPGELAKHAVSEGTKAVTKFFSSGW